MTRSLFCVLGCAVLPLGFVFAPWFGAIAGQTITISDIITPINHNVYGNGTPRAAIPH